MQKIPKQKGNMMKTVNLNRDWQFKNVTLSKGKADGEGWNKVDLPHDFSIELERNADVVGGSSNAYIPGGIGWYEKELDIPSDWLNKRILLDIEGVYMNANVFVNKQLLAKHPYGYTGFQVDLTGWLHSGLNHLKIEACNAGMANTRWYSGSGIYRPVKLLVADKLFAHPWGISIKNTHVSEAHSTVSISTMISYENRDLADIVLRHTVLAGQSIVTSSEKVITDELLNVSIEDNNYNKNPLNTIFTEKSESAALLIHHKVQMDMEVDNARLWSLEDPFLYILKTEIIEGGKVIDTQNTSFGIRSIAVDANNGFLLNGIPVKMKGGCVHHDCGILGSAAYKRAEERKVELLKASGFNAIRCAHNPPSVAFLDACDRLGMLVIDEAFDCWRHGKNPGDYNQVFEDWWQRDIASMVNRDKNHPSVVIWSTGNEILERDGCSNGAVWAKKLAAEVRSLDDSRPITNALCELWVPKNETETIEEKNKKWEDATTEFTEPLDIVGYNYLLHRYEGDAARYPGRVICGTETFPYDAFDYWEATEKLPYVIGDFVWTSMDYLGEAGLGHVRYDAKESFSMPYPWHHANCGDIDICGRKRPQSYYRDCVWGIAKVPYIGVYHPDKYGMKYELSRWGWPEVYANWNWGDIAGKPCRIDVYSMEDEVKLMLNGKEVGRAPAGKANKYIATFDVSYEPGVLEAIGIKNGMEVSKSQLITSGSPKSIQLVADRVRLDGGFGDLSYIHAQVVDDAGNIVTDATNRLFFTAAGKGNLLAVGNGNPKSTEMYVGNTRSAYQGTATAVARSNGEPGEMLITVSGEGLATATITIEIA